jgi:hypothetical protein
MDVLFSCCQGTLCWGRQPSGLSGLGRVRQVAYAICEQLVNKTWERGTGSGPTNPNYAFDNMHSAIHPEDALARRADLYLLVRAPTHGQF